MARQNDAGPHAEEAAQQAGIGRREGILEVVDMDHRGPRPQNQQRQQQRRPEVDGPLQGHRAAPGPEARRALADDAAPARNQLHAPAVGQQAAREVVDELLATAPRGGREYLDDGSGVLHKDKYSENFQCAIRRRRLVPQRRTVSRSTTAGRNACQRSRANISSSLREKKLRMRCSPRVWSRSRHT